MAQKTALLLDYFCYIITVAALLWYGHTTIAAWAGAFGIVYLYKMTQRYFIINETDEISSNDRMF